MKTKPKFRSESRFDIGNITETVFHVLDYVISEPPRHALDIAIELYGGENGEEAADIVERILLRLADQQKIQQIDGFRYRKIETEAQRELRKQRSLQTNELERLRYFQTHNPEPTERRDLLALCEKIADRQRRIEILQVIEQ